MPNSDFFLLSGNGATPERKNTCMANIVALGVRRRKYKNSGRKAEKMRNEAEFLNSDVCANIIA